MGTLTLVRHGQASLGSQDYDRLSRLGRQQSRLLGAHWAVSGARFDQVLVGPLRRHRETLQEMRAGFKAHGGELQRGEAVEDLCEHQAIAVLERTLGPSQDQTEAASDPRATRAWFKRFDAIMRRWIAGELEYDDLEDWQTARQRVERSLDRLLDGRAGERILAVTSGGFACMAVGASLRLDDLQVYELSLELRNTAWVELRFNTRGSRLSGFNLHPHLSEAELHTLV